MGRLAWGSGLNTQKAKKDKYLRTRRPGDKGTWNVPVDSIQDGEGLVPSWWLYLGIGKNFRRLGLARRSRTLGAWSWTIPCPSPSSSFSTSLLRWSEEHPLTMPFHHDVLHNYRPRNMEPGDHGLKLLKPSTKMNLSSFCLSWVFVTVMKVWVTQLVRKENQFIWATAGPEGKVLRAQVRYIGRGLSETKRQDVLSKNVCCSLRFHKWGLKEWREWKLGKS